MGVLEATPPSMACRREPERHESRHVEDADPGASKMPKEVPNWTPSLLSASRTPAKDFPDAIEMRLFCGLSWRKLASVNTACAKIVRVWWGDPRAYEASLKLLFGAEDSCCFSDAQSLVELVAKIERRKLAVQNCLTRMAQAVP